MEWTCPPQAGGQRRHTGALSVGQDYIPPRRIADLLILDPLSFILGSRGEIKMTEKDFYTIAHLMAATIRIFEYQKGHPPSIEQVCETLSFTSEQVHIYLNKLTDLEILEVVEGNFGTRIFLRDHLKIEEIPKGKKESGIGDAVKAFQDSRSSGCMFAYP